MSLLSTAAGCVPLKLRSALRAAFETPSRLAFRRGLDARPFSLPVGTPALNYGGLLPRSPQEIVHGGRVKLLGLAAAFPESCEGFNTLYLVSSALPRHARELVQWAQGRGVKFVWNQNGVGFPAWAGNDFERINEPMVELLRRADFVVYQSAFCRESADRWLGPARGPSEMLFNPVDLARFAPADAPPPLDCWRLLAAGNHFQPRRVLIPIEALRQLHQEGHRAHLTIAGRLHWPGAQRDVEEALSRSGMKEFVTLRPAFTQAEAAEIYHGAHVLLHLKYHDPCPTVVLEALASGVPVVGSRSGGLPELVGEAGGVLIEIPLSWEKSTEPEPEQIANAVTDIMRAWPQRHAAARERAVRLFDADSWVAQHRRIFEQLLST